MTCSLWIHGTISLATSQLLRPLCSSMKDFLVAVIATSEQTTLVLFVAKLFRDVLYLTMIGNSLLFAFCSLLFHATASFLSSLYSSHDSLYTTCRYTICDGNSRIRESKYSIPRQRFQPMNRKKCMQLNFLGILLVFSCRASLTQGVPNF